MKDGTFTRHPYLWMNSKATARLPFARTDTEMGGGGVVIVPIHLPFSRRSASIVWLFFFFFFRFFLRWTKRTFFFSRGGLFLSPFSSHTRNSGVPLYVGGAHSFDVRRVQSVFFPSFKRVFKRIRSGLVAFRSVKLPFFFENSEERGLDWTLSFFFVWILLFYRVNRDRRGALFLWK